MNRLRYFYMNTAEILDKVFDIYKKTFFQQLLRVFIVSTVSSVLYIITLIFIMIFGLVLAPRIVSYNSASSGAATVILFVVVILFALVTGYIASANSAAALSICAQAFYGKKPNFNKTFKEALRGSPRVFSANILVFLMYIPLAAGIMFLLYVTGFFGVFGYDPSYFYDLDMWPVRRIRIIITIIGIILLIVPGAIYIQTITSCATGSALFEKTPFHMAIRRSLILTKGARFKISLVLIIWSFVNFAVSYSFMGIFTIISGLTAYLDYQTLNSLLFILPFLQFLVSVLIFLLMAPFKDIIISLIYFNQKIKKEGLDIILELETGA